MSIESVMPSNHLILCCPLLLLPSIFSSIRVFSSESLLPIRWPKYWSLSFSISPSNEYSGLISFRIDWFDLCSSRDSQVSSSTPQCKSINSLVLGFLYGPTQSPAIATTTDGEMVSPGEAQDVKTGYCPQIGDVYIKGMISTLASSHT